MDKFADGKRRKQSSLCFDDTHIFPVVSFGLVVKALWDAKFTVLLEDIYCSRSAARVAMFIECVLNKKKIY